MYSIYIEDKTFGLVFIIYNDKMLKILVNADEMFADT